MFMQFGARMKAVARLGRVNHLWDIVPSARTNRRIRKVTDIDYASFLVPDLPPPARHWNGFPSYNFVGGHVDDISMPVDDMIAATASVLKREGATLATYGMQSGPLGYRPLRDFVATKLEKRSGLSVSPDDVLITSGSNQGLDLVNTLFCQPGDTVLVEQFSYGGALTRLRRIGVNPVGIPLDGDGMRTDLLVEKLVELQNDGVQPRFIYVIPTIQNPGGSIMPEHRRAELLQISERYAVPIFEDECYADLLWSGERPPAIAAMDDSNRVIHCGSFSKTIAPALRVGYIVAESALIMQMLACKNDGGTGALEQMMLAEFCTSGFDTHVTNTCVVLKNKLDAMTSALEEYYGVAAEFEPPAGGIFLWVSLPDTVDTMKLAAVAATRGIAINPGPEWSSDVGQARSKMRLCFGNPSIEMIRDGVRQLADLCHQEFGVPIRSANVERG